jgi:co-chaperonin GroES (HSP10)
MGKNNPDNIKVVKGYVLVAPIEDQSTESIIIEDAHATPQWGKVLKVGPKTWHEGIAKEYLPPCKVGDTIIHSSMGYEQFRIEGEPYRLVPFGRILAVANE